MSHGDWDHISGILQLLEEYETNLLGENGGSISLGQIFVPDTGEGEQVKAGEAESEDPMEQIRRLAGASGIFVSAFPEGCLLYTS